MRMMGTPEKSREARGATGKEEVSLEMQDKEGKEGGEEEEEEVEEEEKLLRRRARAYCRNQLKEKTFDNN